MNASRTNELLTQSILDVEREAQRAADAEVAAKEQARRAVEQWETANAFNLFVTEDLFASAAPSSEPGKGRDVMLATVLDNASRALESGDRFAGMPTAEADLRDMLGSVYAELGRFDAALPQFRSAMTLRASALGDEHEETLTSASKLATVLRRAEGADAAKSCRRRPTRPNGGRSATTIARRWLPRTDWGSCTWSKRASKRPMRCCWKRGSTPSPRCRRTTA